MNKASQKMVGAAGLSYSSRSERAACQVRRLSVQHNTFGYADSSVLFEMGGTKVLCSVTLQQGVPPFLRGKQTGWLSAEYAMLPTATAMRKQRDNSGAKPNGRSIEISRLIGRCLRSVVDVSKIGERTIVIDCDVLQADGGTRTACISGASMALKSAISCWIERGVVSPDAVILKEEIAAISVGLTGNELLLDIDFAEDSSIAADFNFVMTRTGSIVEIQGTAEKHPISQKQFQQVHDLAREGIRQLFAFFDSIDQGYILGQSAVASSARSKVSSQAVEQHRQEKAPLFSLKNRLHSKSE